MTGDNTSLFKVFRVLWFPMSINAMVLGAAAVALFWAGTWAGCAALGFPEGTADEVSAGSESSRLARSFAVTALMSIERRDWPETPAYTRGEMARAGSIDAFALRLPNPENYGWLFAWQSVLAVLLWATFGVAICRVLALRIARDEYCSLGTAFSYAWRVKTTGILYPVAVALPIAFLLVCNQLAGMLTSIPWLGWIVGALFLPLVLIASLLTLLIAVAAIISVGFMPAAIATERKGTYDSLGKSFNYVFARPIPLILHMLVLTTFLGLIHTLLVEQRVVEGLLADTMTPWLWGDDAFQGSFQAMLTGQTEALEGFQKICGYLFMTVHTIYRLLVWGALIAFAFGAFTSLFLIFRQDVDGMEYIDVARDPAEAPDVALAPAPPPAEPSPEGDSSGD